MKNIVLKNNAAIIFILVIDIALFSLGYASGYASHLSEVKKYAGTVIEKEYLPEEIKEDPATKTIEKFEEEYIVKVKDHAGDIVVMNLGKEEFNQVDIGEKLRR